MPSKIWLLADQGHHGVDPFWMLQAGQSTVQRIADVAKSIPALQGVTTSAYAARYFRKLRACNTFIRWQVISRARHFRGLAQAACYFFASASFIFSYVKLMSCELIAALAPSDRQSRSFFYDAGYVVSKPLMYFIFLSIKYFICQARYSACCLLAASGPTLPLRSITLMLEAWRLWLVDFTARFNFKLCVLLPWLHA